MKDLEEFGMDEDGELIRAGKDATNQKTKEKHRRQVSME